MGGLLDKPKTEKYSEQGSGNGLSFGLSCMQGWRAQMEDAHSAVVNLQGDLKDWSFFGVFDGHAGDRVSAHCAKHLLEAITSRDEFKSASSKRDISSEDDGIESIKKGIHEGFLKLDESMRQMPEVESGDDRSGTTAVCALMSPTHIFVANCGDSRAVLCSSAEVGLSTEDHKPNNPLERERIEKAGGSVMIQRVNGALAVSRALGDYEYKNVEGLGPCLQLVSPEPEIYVETRSSQDEFLILACDGVWDVMTNENLCAFVRSRLQISRDLESISNQVIDTCFYKGSKDNMSVILIVFPGAPSISEEAVKNELQLEEFLEKRLTELCQMEEPVSISDLMEQLSTECIKNLPPGGGLESKHTFIQNVFKRLRPDCADSENVWDSSDGLGNLVFFPSDVMREKLSSVIGETFRGDSS